ncbi:hypothetical protein [Aestuariimicrobium sp. T2.26MG-19.2B]|uniref:hypothetical protein n=1 Tax=Aestuariimicrobium sp. T2.26MG-19.2B TaxID=3040679 RepID=UPI00254135FF|nr:hypothetical protein [Aestuariimicrobium sp. T2.26MG-19.2B]
MARDNADLGTVVEMRKWERYLLRLGHQAIRITGDPDVQESRRLGRGSYHVVPRLSPSHPETLATRALIAEGDRPTTQASKDATWRSINERLRNASDALRHELAAVLDQVKPDGLLVDALLSYPISLPANTAILEEATARSLKLLSRSHNFVWDGVAGSSSYYNSLAGTTLPPIDKVVRHLVLTKVAYDGLVAKFPRANAHVVPNLFAKGVVPTGHHAAAVREASGVSTRDLLGLQPTRCIPSKGVHLAIHALHELGQRTGRRAFLGLTASTLGLGGKTAHSVGARYRDELDRLASRLGVTILDLGPFASCPDPAGHSGTCINDAYLACDLVTYLGVSESFGNPVMETSLLRTPILVSDYAVLREQFHDQGFRFFTAPALGTSSVTSTDWLFDINQHNIPTATLDALAAELDDYSCTTRAMTNQALAERLYGEDDSVLIDRIAPHFRWLEQ